jgi:hypothetical protein
MGRMNRLLRYSMARAIARKIAVKLNNSAAFSVTEVDELTYLANTLGSDKGTLCHQYTRVYRQIFDPWRTRPLTLLEIGLMRTESDGRRSNSALEGRSNVKAERAPSLEMWRTYFPRALIYGFDIDDFGAVRIPDCTIVQGDMSSREDLASLTTRIGRPIDIVIDDGSHASHHQQLAFGQLFPTVAPGGVYVIEDLGWQPPDYEKEDSVKTRALLRRLAETGRFESPYVSAAEKSYIEDHTASVRLFDSMHPDLSTGEDALAIVAKR